MTESQELIANQIVKVETVYFGVIRARVIGSYPKASPPYVNLWLLEGYPAFYTTSHDKVHNENWQEGEA